MTARFMIVLVLITAVWGDYTVTRNDNIVKDLLLPCQAILASEIQEALNNSKNSESEFKAANETCQKSLLTIVSSCRGCVKEQCFKRAQLLNCTITADFNKTFNEGIEGLEEKIKNFFNVAIPKFFTEDLTKFFGNDIPYFFLNDFTDFFKKTVPEFFTTTFPDFFTSDIPNFFNTKFKNFFTVDVKQFFQKDVKNFFVKDVPTFVDDAKKKFSSWFSGRKRRELTSEPLSCEDFKEKDKVLRSCAFYLQNCTECLPSLEEREKVCPDLAKAHKKMKENLWIIQGVMSNGTIIEITSVSTTNKNDKENTFENPVISLILFGKDIKVQLNGSVYLPDKEKTCKAISKAAVDAFKSNSTDVAAKE